MPDTSFKSQGALAGLISICELTEIVCHVGSTCRAEQIVGCESRLVGLVRNLTPSALLE